MILIVIPKKTRVVFSSQNRKDSLGSRLCTKRNRNNHSTNTNHLLENKANCKLVPGDMPFFYLNRKFTARDMQNSDINIRERRGPWDEVVIIDSSPLSDFQNRQVALGDQGCCGD